MELKFVDIGEGITEGHLLKWLVKDGDTVKEDQPIVQIETDKAVVNLPAPTSGAIRIQAKENTDIKVGDVLAMIGNGSEGTSGNAATPSEPKQAAPAVAAQVQASRAKDILAPPSIRKLAEELHVDLSKVSGTGPHGRILEADVRSASSGSPQQPAVQAQAPASAPAPKGFPQGLEAQHSHEIERIPLTQTRKAIAKNMELSWTIPRAAHMDLINATSLFEITQREKARAMKELGVKITLLPFIIKAVVEGLRENPNFNASFDKEKQEIIRKKYYNIGLAAEAPDGLKVVVIKDADKKSIVQIAREIQELHKKVQDQTITLDEMRDSTFTITNIGSLGGGFLSVPMINYPEVAILGIHLMRDMPIVDNGMIKAAKILPFSIVFDHRVVDGAEAVKFGNVLIDYLQDPDFLEMLG